MLSQDKKRLYIMLGGAIVTIVVGVVLALMLSSGKKDTPKMNTSPTGLQVELNEAPNIGTQTSLRCFVNGEYVGQFTLSDCAKKNGVAAQALEVGTDDSGQLAAAPTASLAPPPAMPQTDVLGDNTAAEALPNISAASGPMGQCLRYASGEWNKLSEALTLGQCVQLLYDGRCERPGSASYGRWAEQSLRLVPGRVEISGDNKSFRPFVDQAKGCAVPLIR
jgi:hypothetical protein